MKKNKNIKKLLAISLIIVCMFSLVGCGTTKVDATEHISVTYNGFDGYATPELKVDTTRLNAYIEDTEKFTEKVKSLNAENEIWVQISSALTLSDLVAFKFSENYENLSNGDVVKVDLVFSDYLSYMTDFETLQETIGVEFTKTSFEFTVEGLEEAKVIDVPNLVKEYIVYNGANGGCTATIAIPHDFYQEIDGYILARDDYWADSIKIVKDNQNIASVKVYFSKPDTNDHTAKQMSNGDTFELWTNTSISNIEFKNAGYIIPEKTNVTVSGLGEYISSPDQLTGKIKFDIDSKINEYVESKKGTYSELSNFKITNHYWATLNPTATVNNPAAEKNQLCITFEYETWFKQFGCFTPEIIIYEDGSYTVALDEYIPTGMTMDMVLSPNHTYSEIEY